MKSDSYCKGRQNILDSFDAFEKTAKGGMPHRLLDSHPNGSHLVLQGGRGPESAVWEKETGRIVWAPDHAIALAWLKQGTQIAALSDACVVPVRCE